MILTPLAVLFVVLSGILLASAVMVVMSRHPVHAVLFLILAFFNAAGLMLIVGAEYIAMMLIVVYVGAVAVLFLFVVMMLDVKQIIKQQGFVSYAPIGLIVLGILAVEAGLLIYYFESLPFAAMRAESPMPTLSITHTEAIARILYTDYLLLFQLAGAILLTAMIGAIVLTLRTRQAGVVVKRQDISAQVQRKARDVVRLVNVPPSSAAKG